MATGVPVETEAEPSHEAAADVRARTAEGSLTPPSENHTGTALAARTLVLPPGVFGCPNP